MGNKGKSDTKDGFQAHGLCTAWLVGPFTNGEKNHNQGKVSSGKAGRE